jgi:hypothetical protein
MISPQSIAVACAATGLVGNESGLFRFTVRHSILLLAVVCLITSLQSNALGWMLPVDQGTAVGAAAVRATAAPASAAVGWACLGTTALLVAGLVLALGRRRA